MTTTTTRPLRWFILASFGSFIAEAEGGTVLVAPMNADGTRSTFDGETIALGEDSRATDPALDLIVRRALTVGKIADAFRSVLRRDLTEDQLRVIDQRNRKQDDPKVCHSHDFCDANMAMLEAFELVTKREHDLNADEDVRLWNDAWDRAREDGFSTWAPTDEDFALLELIAERLGSAPEAARLRLFVDRIRIGIVEPAADPHA